MNEEQQQILFKRAIKIFGKRFQWNHLIEEMGELIAAINHLKRDKIVADQLYKEIADVIMKIGMCLATDKKGHIMDRVNYYYQENLKHLENITIKKELKNKSDSVS